MADCGLHAVNMCLPIRLISRKFMKTDPKLLFAIRLAEGYAAVSHIPEIKEKTQDLTAFSLTTTTKKDSTDIVSVI